jgi:hypothetical protein
MKISLMAFRNELFIIYKIAEWRKDIAIVW